MVITIKKTKLNQIIAYGFLLRLILLLTIFIFSEEVSKGFMGSVLMYDDVRYETGAEIYASDARGLFDLDAFQNAYWKVNDYIGFHDGTIFESTPLWYWICCTLVYIFHTTWAIRLLNIILGCLSIWVIYYFTKEFCDEKTSLLAAKLMAFMPYQLFFCCFAYKDQFVLFLNFLLFYLAAIFRKGKKFTIRYILVLAFATLSLMLLRSGMAIFTIFVALLIGLGNEHGVCFINVLKKLKKTTLIIIIIGLISIIIVLLKHLDIIMFKVYYYFYYKYAIFETSKASISIAVIDSPSQIWKLPISFLISIILPIGTYGQFNSWYGVVSTLNYLSVPIMIGNALYLIKQKFDSISYNGIIFLYLVSAVTSINVCRHYYAFLPICYIAFSDCFFKCKEKDKLFLYIGTMLAVVILIQHYFLKAI